MAIDIKKHEKTYINEPFSWDYTLYDILSICSFYLGSIDDALKYSDIAVSMAPDNDRIIKNNEIIKNEINK